MASLTSAIVQNENLHIHRGIEWVKADAPKPVKTGHQERKALRDLSQATKSLLSAAKKGSTLKDKSAASTRETVKEASKINILTDEKIAKCQEWAKEGIEQLHFSGNDMQKFEAHQQEEHIEVHADTEDVLKLEFEQEDRFPSQNQQGMKKLARTCSKLDCDSLYFHQPFDIKLKEEYDGDIACF